ncbi:MAG TPA: HlyD family efflux transporter periplasmic adaptor subunit [Xanthobacteraceae bacterium]|jgi:HlyD family secretion protein|nr:HlyD family efflux transporter periplasmic adaptor subunit [Xanthobacteraceae bacterium]
MSTRVFLGAVLACLFVVASVPLPTVYLNSAAGRFFAPTAQAKGPVRNFVTRLLGQSLPDGIVKTNGRIEATQVDVAAKYPGRLTDITVEEGSEVKAGQVVGRVSSPEYEAQLRAAQSNVDKAKQALVEAEAQIVQRDATLAAAKSDYDRGVELVGKQIITQQTFDQRKRNYEGGQANVQAAIAQRDQAEAAIKAAQADAERLESILKDLILVSPRTGRVQYQLARNGEVVAAGGKVFTVLDLHDVYMTVFLPAASAGKLEIGDEARIILDPVPQFVVPAKVSFVAADAQFTPKTVETADEREKLMFRVKLQLDAEVLKKFSRRVKTGVRGLGIVRTNAASKWPDDLQVNLPQ